MSFDSSFSPNYRPYSLSRVELISDSDSKFVTCHPRNLISVELYWRMCMSVDK